MTTGWILVAGSVFLSVAAAVFLDKKRTEEAWRDAAKRLGFVHREGGFLGQPSMAGRHLGMEVRVDVEIRGSGKHRRSYTRYRALFDRPLGMNLWVGKEGFLSSVSKFFGSQDIQLGDPAVDKVLMIKGRDEVQVRAYLDRGRREAAMTFIRGFPDGEIDDEGMKLVRSHVARTADQIISNVEDVVKAALAFRA